MKLELWQQKWSWNWSCGSIYGKLSRLVSSWSRWTEWKWKFDFEIFIFVGVDVLQWYLIGVEIGLSLKLALNLKSKLKLVLQTFNSTNNYSNKHMYVQRNMIILPGIVRIVGDGTERYLLPHQEGRRHDQWAAAGMNEYHQVYNSVFFSFFFKETIHIFCCWKNENTRCFMDAWRHLFYSAE